VKTKRKSKRRQEEKRAFGALSLIGWTAVVCLAIAAMARYVSSSSTLLRAARAAGGAACEQAALSAVEEAAWQFLHKVNDPDTVLYRNVRDGLVTGVQRDLCVEDACRPELLEALLRDGTSVQGPTAKVQLSRFRASLDLHGARLSLSVEAAMPLGQGVVRRRVEASYECCLTHVSEPKPYDQLPFAVAQLNYLALQPVVVGEWLDRMEEYEMQRNLLDGLLAWLATFPRPEAEARFSYRPCRLYRSETGGVGKGVQARADAEVPEPVAAPPIELVLPGWAAFDTSWQSRRVTPNRMLREMVPVGSVLVALEKTVRLPDHDTNVMLATSFFESDDEVLGAAAKLVEEHEELRQAAEKARRRGKPMDVDDVQRFVSLAAESCNTAARGFDEGTKRYNAFARYLLGHCLGHFHEPPVRSTAWAPLGYLIHQRKSVDELAELLTTYGGMTGHVFIAKPDEADEDPLMRLKIAGWQGHGVVSTFRPTRVRDVLLASFDEDLLVLGLGDVELGAGSVQAGVSCCTATFAGPTSITGNLVIGAVPFFREPPPEARFAGSVRYDGRLFSGFPYECARQAQPGGMEVRHS